MLAKNYYQSFKILNRVSSKNRVDRVLIYWILSVFSIVLYQFVNAGFHNVLLYTMYLVPFIFLFKYKHFYITDLSLLGVFVLMLLTYFIQPITFRLATVAYSGLFFITFFLYKTLCRSGAINPNDYIRFIRFIIYAYAIVLIIQQIQVTFGLYVFNKQAWIFDNKYKLNSLSMEPSNTLLILPLMMFSYVKSIAILRKELRYNIVNNFKKDKYVWIAFLYICLTCGSMTAFFSLPIFFLYFVDKKAIIYIPFIFLLGLFVYISIKPEGKLNARFLNLTHSLGGDTKKIIDQDVSASVRIIPYIEYFKSFNVSDYSTWFGHGIDQFEVYSSKLILGDSYSKEKKIGAKSILALFYDHGIVTGLLFFFFLLKNTTKRFLSFETLFYITLFSVIPLNHYILWLYIMMMFTNKYLAKKSISKKIPLKQIIYYENRHRCEVVF